MRPEAYRAWAGRTFTWPFDRAFAESAPDLATAWASCQDGRWMAAAAKGLGLWDAVDAPESDFYAAQLVATLTYDTDRDADSPRVAMERWEERMRVARLAYADSMRAALPVSMVLGALAAWDRQSQRVTRYIEANKARNEGQFRGADYWSDIDAGREVPWP